MLRWLLPIERWGATLELLLEREPENELEGLSELRVSVERRMSLP